MVDSSWTYTISHFDSSSSWNKTDITDDSFMRVFSDTVEGEVKTGIVRVRADNGQYIQSGVNGKVQIVINDRIQVEATDGDGNSWHHMFEVVRKKPIKSKTEGVMLELELLGIERWLQKVNYVKRHFGTNASDVFQDLVDAYNENAAIATNLPTLVISRNNLPSTLTLSLDWGVNEDSIFNRMTQLTDSQSASGSNFGVLDFFDLRFTTDLNDATTVNVEVFSSGDSPTKPTITVSSDSVNVNTEDTDAGFEEPEGTLVNAWGANGAGSLPTNFSKFQSREQLMPTNKGSDSLFPEWDNTFGYKTGALIKYTSSTVNKCYERTGSDVSPPTGLTPITDPGWTEITVNDYAGDIQYSPWTDGNHIKWKASGADPGGLGSSPFGPAMFDANLVINDENTFQTWADVKATSPSGISSQWKYGGSTLYDGLRVLVNGTGSGGFTSNSVMEYNQGEWRVKYEGVTDMMVAVINDAIVYKYNGSSWISLSSDANGLHCFHPMDGGTTSNAESLFTKSDGTGAEYTNNQNSSVKVSYTWTPTVGWTDEATQVLLDLLESVGWPTTNTRNAVDWYKAGAWLCMRFPFPRTSYGGAGNVGSLYGGSTSTNIVPFLDTQNMHLLSDGKRGFNHGDTSEEYGQLSSIDFLIKLKFSRDHVTLGEQLVSKGNFKMRCVVFDASDNVATQEFTVTHNDNPQAISLPLSGFEIYRGRRPIFEDGFGINDIIPPEGRPSFNQFEWRHVVAIVIQTQESYDDFGRYRGASDNDMGTGSPFWEEVQNVISSFKMEMWIDAFRFGKPLLVNSGQVTDLDNQPDFLQRPDIFNYEQLKNDAKAELEKLKFQKKIYQIRTEVAFDVKPGDYFYFEDDELVDESDNGANTIKLVARHIDYTTSKNRGFERVITANRRFS